MKKISRYLPVYITPYLVALVPAIFLYAQNIRLINVSIIPRSFLVIVILTFLVHQVLIRILKNAEKALLILCVLALFIFSYGHITRNVPEFQLFSLDTYTIGKFKTIFLAMIFIGGFLSWKIIHAKRFLHIACQYIFFASLTIITFNLLHIITFWIKPPAVANMSSLQKTFPHSSPVDLPDIYYIILDGHARADVLKEAYNYEDTILTPYLKSKDFYIATKSQTNYSSIAWSLASSLNFDTIEHLSSTVYPYSASQETLTKLIEYNATATLLKKYGYTYVTFNSGFTPTETNPFADKNFDYAFGLNRFEQLVLNTTVFSKLLRSVANIDLNQFHRDRILFILESLKEIPQDPQPTFTFAHIVSPHPPFVFDPSGQSVHNKKRFTLVDGGGFPGTKDEYKQGYLDQLIFVDKKVVEVIEIILSTSETKPIIIIQSDHGPALTADWNKQGNDRNPLAHVIDRNNPQSIKERTSILNAYYFPDKEQGKLYEEISPLNSFRILFNTYFEDSFPLLKDSVALETQE